MAEARMTIGKGLLLIGLSLCLFSCAHSKSILEMKREVQIPKETTGTAATEKAPPVKTPDFMPAQEEASPIKTRIVDLVARNTPLQDVLLTLTDTAGLNLVMDREVNPTIPVTLSLKNVTVEDALDKVFSSVHFFYTVKGNMLYVKVTETRTYELGHPSVVQTYYTDLGGDMLGAALSQTGGSGQLKGSISKKTESDKTAYNFWEVIEKSIEKMLAVPAGAASFSPQSVTVNRLTGTIVVTATKNSLQKVENFVQTIRKIINRQVIVEAKVIEVSLTDRLQYGIDWTSVITFSNRQSGTIGTSNFASVVSSTGPAFFAGTTAADFTALLSAIHTQGEVRLLSNPRVNIMNGQTSLLSVGKNVSFISSVQTTQTTVTGSMPTITYTISTGSVLSGIMLGIVPHINENGEVTLSITPIISDLLELKDEKFGTPDSQGNYPYRIQLPSVNLRQLSTTVKVPNKEMVIIGGLITKREDLTDYKIPWLGDIPMLGYLFKRRDRNMTNVELVILLQPVVISN